MRLGAYYADARARAPRSPQAYGEPVVSASATVTATSSTPGTAAQLRSGRPAAARARRPTIASSSSSSCADHPFWVGTQAHPEFKSRPDRPHPLFRELVAARARPPRGPRAAPVRRRRARSAKPSVSMTGFRHLERSTGPPGPRLARGGRRASSRPTVERVPPRHRALARCGRPSCRSMFDAEGNPSVVLVRQYRPPYDDIVLEIPAGMRDIAGEPTGRDRALASWSRRSGSTPGSLRTCSTSSTRRRA